MKCTANAPGKTNQEGKTVCNLLIYMVGGAGFEPATNGLKERCTDWLCIKYKVLSWTEEARKARKCTGMHRKCTGVLVAALMGLGGATWAQDAPVVDWGRWASDPRINATPPAPGVQAGPVQVPMYVAPPSVVPVMPAGFIGPVETGFPGAAYRVPGAGRTHVYTDPIGRVWYLPATGPKPMIEMPKSFDPVQYYRDVTYPKLKAQGIDAPAPKK